MKVSIDSLSFTTDKLHELVQKKPTQRNLLRAASSIFDPIGIAAIVTIWLQKIQQAFLEKRTEVERPNYTRNDTWNFLRFSTKETIYRQWK